MIGSELVNKVYWGAHATTPPSNEDCVEMLAAWHFLGFDTAAAPA